MRPETTGSHRHKTRVREKNLLKVMKHFCNHRIEVQHSDFRSLVAREVRNWYSRMVNSTHDCIPT